MLHRWWSAAVAAVFVLGSGVGIAACSGTTATAGAAVPARPSPGCTAPTSAAGSTDTGTGSTTTGSTATGSTGTRSSGPGSTGTRSSGTGSTGTRSSGAGLAGAGTADPAPVHGATERTIPFIAADEFGSYIQDVPPSRRGARHPWPVVVDLHGYLETASLQEDISGLGAYGDHHGFVTITPQVDYSVQHWDDDADSADVRFLGTLLTHVEDALCVDEARIYVTGYSNGAFMTSRLACQYSTRVAAVAPVAGLQDYPDCHAARPVPVVTFHGTADPFVSFTGGPGPKALLLPAPNGSGLNVVQEAEQDPHADIPAPIGQPIPVQVAGWARRNGCRSAPARRRIGTDVTLIAYHCPATASVEFYEVTGGGHTWPGSRVSASLASVTGKTTFTVSADEVMWRFFEAHPLPTGVR